MLELFCNFDFHFVSIVLRRQNHDDLFKVFASNSVPVAGASTESFECENFHVSCVSPIVGIDNSIWHSFACVVRAFCLNVGKQKLALPFATDSIAIIFVTSWMHIFFEYAIDCGSVYSASERQKKNDAMQMRKRFFFSSVRIWHTRNTRGNQDKSETNVRAWNWKSMSHSRFIKKEKITEAKLKMPLKKNSKQNRQIIMQFTKRQTIKNGFYGTTISLSACLDVAEVHSFAIRLQRPLDAANKSTRR